MSLTLVVREHEGMTSVGRRGAPDGSTSASGIGTDAGSALRPGRTGAADTSSEPHSPHSGQRPSHFGDSWAQAVQR